MGRGCLGVRAGSLLGSELRDDSSRVVVGLTGNENGTQSVAKSFERIFPKDGTGACVEAEYYAVAQGINAIVVPSEIHERRYAI